MTYTSTTFRLLRTTRYATNHLRVLLNMVKTDDMRRVVTLASFHSGDKVRFVRTVLWMSSPSATALSSYGEFPGYLLIPGGMNGDRWEAILITKSLTSSVVKSR